MPSKKLYIVPLQIVAGAISAFAIYFGSESFFNFITDILRPVFHYGYPDSLFAAIVLYVPILSVLATSIYILCKKLYWLFSGFFIGIFAAIIITLQGLSGL